MHHCSELLIHIRYCTGKEELSVDIGAAQQRDPDALPPQNSLETIMNIIYHTSRDVFRGNQLFAIKAGILTGQHSRLTK
jgi:hypothetical protein